jgi:hypothetical protein
VCSRWRRFVALTLAASCDSRSSGASPKRDRAAQQQRDGAGDRDQRRERPREAAQHPLRAFARRRDDQLQVRALAAAGDRDGLRHHVVAAVVQRVLLERAERRADGHAVDRAAEAEVGVGAVDLVARRSVGRFEVGELVLHQAAAHRRGRMRDDHLRDLRARVDRRAQLGEQLAFHHREQPAADQREHEQRHDAEHRRQPQRDRALHACLSLSPSSRASST